MAIQTTDKYLNLVFSLLLSNRAKTTEFFALPDDFRKLEDIKVKDSRISSFSVAAGATYTFNVFDSEQNFFFLIGSHPFVLSRLNFTSFGATSRPFTSFIALGRDRPGSFNLNVDPFCEIQNTLEGPNYDRVSGSGETELQIVAVELSIEA